MNKLDFSLKKNIKVNFNLFFKILKKLNKCEFRILNYKSIQCFGRH